jgi:hypothetical protein
VGTKGKEVERARTEGLGEASTWPGTSSSAPGWSLFIDIGILGTKGPGMYQEGGVVPITLRGQNGRTLWLGAEVGEEWRP